MNEYENQPADDASGEIPRPTIDDYEAPETEGSEVEGSDVGTSESEKSAVEAAPSHALRRTLIFAGAATAAGSPATRRRARATAVDRAFAEYPTPSHRTLRIL